MKFLLDYLIRHGGIFILLNVYLNVPVILNRALDPFDFSQIRIQVFEKLTQN